MEKSYVVDIDRIKQKTLEAIKLADELIEFMKETGIRSNYPELNELYVNPFYNQISEDSALVVENYYGFPSKVYSPVGYINITQSYTCIDVHVEEFDSEKFFKDLEDKFNLKMFEEPVTNALGVIGGWLSIGGVEVNNTRNFEYDEAKKLFKECLQEYINSK